MLRRDARTKATSDRPASSAEGPRLGSRMPFVVVGQVQAEWQAEEHDVGDGLDDRIVEIGEEVPADEGGEHVEVQRPQHGAVEDAGPTRRPRDDAIGAAAAVRAMNGRQKSRLNATFKTGRRSSARRAATALVQGAFAEGDSGDLTEGLKRVVEPVDDRVPRHFGERNVTETSRAATTDRARTRRAASDMPSVAAL